MAARRSVWSNDKVQALASKFVAVADEVGRLQRGTDDECRFFQTIAEQGHYGGRVKPSNTRQGIYAFTATGRFLASLNTRDAAQVASMLKRALARFAELTPAERSGAGAAASTPLAHKRFEAMYPDDGLVLHVFARDLARDKIARGWRGQAWNQDFAWFRKAEVDSMLPEATAGAERALPPALLHRLVRCHLVDVVRGQSPAHRVEDIKDAALTLSTEAVDGDVLVLRLRGHARIERQGTWPTNSFGAAQQAQMLGFDAQLLGTARYDTKTARFVSFRLLAVGERWGGTEFNGRHDDLGPSAIGVAFTLAGATERTAPASWWLYEWR